MKARVKATGEIVEIIETDFAASNGMIYYEEDLIIPKDEPDYWEKLKHQYAGMAMQGMIINGIKDLEVITHNSLAYAETIIEKLKEEEK